ncbi:TniQ family protein [Actinomadura harenae]|uniref:TniQ domain-containing protein n=1 Tax=Actinomadura harenae TaxID=2483351 RepID=A0A3M2L363_9ACTN|nr:TniQ family protein [Actinomadura harenae]RMI31130.1 hypothetical protein EBO15_42645 [Actinomadura harenae]
MTTLHRLPLTPPPIRNETLGSYLHRLAMANNRPARSLAALLGPPPIGFSPISDDTSGWTPQSPANLAALTGRRVEKLARALPALASFLAVPCDHPTQLIGRACRCCSARRRAGTASVFTYIPIHQHLCIRHQRWTRATIDIPLAKLPAVLQAQHRLTRLAHRHRSDEIKDAFCSAQKILRGWTTTQLPIDLTPDWNSRLERIRDHPPGRGISSQDQQLVASFPDTVTLTALVLSPPTGSDARTTYLAATTELEDRYARPYNAPGIRDPLYQYFRKSQIA